jgi:hypothetical protein
MGLYETRSVRSFLERNFLGIKDVFELLGMQDDYENFLQDCEAEIRQASVEEMRAELDGFIPGYRSGTEALRLALRHTYVLSRMAELAMGDGKFEKSLFLLNEASYRAGLAQGIGWAKYWENWQPETDSSEAARYAAKARHQKASEPVKEEILKLLESNGRGEKWTFLSSAIDSIEKPLGIFLVKTGATYKLENMARITVPNWSRKDTDFRKRLCRFINLPEQN